MSKLLLAVGSCGFLIASIACASRPAVTEEEVIIGLTDGVVVPGYRAVAAESGNLRVALEDLCSAPSELAMDRAREAWRDTRAAWKRSEATWLGPVMDRRSVSVMDWSPTDPIRIESMLSDNPASTEEEVRGSLASTQRGFGAIEYVLFGGDALRRLSERDMKRCAYLIALGELIESESAAILDEWSVDRNGKPPYGEYFTGRASASLLTSRAVADVVRTQVFLVRTIVDMRLASALGLREGGPDHSSIPGGDGQNALDDLRNEVLGMWDMYAGPEGEGGGISALVLALSAETDERMRGHFENSLAAIDRVEAPLMTAIGQHPQQVQAVYDALQNLQTTLNTEVVSLLGISVGFSDTDGDSLR